MMESSEHRYCGQALLDLNMSNACGFIKSQIAQYATRNRAHRDKVAAPAEIRWERFPRKFSITGEGIAFDRAIGLNRSAATGLAVIVATEFVGG